MKVLIKPEVKEAEDENLIYAYERDTIPDKSCQK